MADEQQTLTDLSQLGTATGVTSAAVAQATTAPAEPQKDEFGRAYATGRRKNAIARVWIKPGSGKVTVNGKDQVTLCRFAQKIDGHVGCDRQRDGPNCAHNRDIHPEIGQGEHGRAADRATGANMARVIGQPDCGRALVEFFNDKAIMGGEGGIRIEDVI